MVSDMLLSIQNLGVQFQTLEGTVTAVEDVSFSIGKGEIVAIVGESGSGKSVTALSVLQLHPKSTFFKGSISYQNKKGSKKDLLQSSEKELQQIRGNEIAMIFQEPMTSLNPVQRCGDQILEAILQHLKCTVPVARTKTIELLHAVQIPDPEAGFNKYPFELSGGQKQRVMIAMAMCNQPQLLICDEPTTALDVTVQKNIVQLIKNLQEQNTMGVLFISHDLGLVSEIADRIVVMYKGVIVENGTTSQILTNPLHAYTKALLACRPVLYPQGTRLPVVADFLDTNTAAVSAAKNTVTIASKPEPSTEVLLEVKNLTVRFILKRNLFGKIIKDFTAVNNVSFHISKGETLGLVGESGCGKTTIGRALLQLVQPASGSIFYRNMDLLRMNQREAKSIKKEMQIVFQDPYSSLNPRKTVGTAIMEPMLVNRIQRNRVHAKKSALELLEKVELLSAHFNRYPHEFSGGQRQRIVIARALALKPDFLVCDESVSALDVSVQAQILNLLNDLKKEFGFTVLFISHDLAVVKYISDRILVMQQGNIIESNSTEQLFINPKEAYTKSLIAAMPGKMAI
jgi:peptide/nickel transport system ATP-binding protein